MPGTAPALFDTHAHLHDDAFRDDLDAVIERAAAAGVGGIVTVGTDLDQSVAAVGLARERAGVWASIGVHPHDAKDWDTATLTRLVVLAGEESVVALGEIGLDFYRDLSPREVQREVFASQLALAGELDLPVIIHSRDAHEETAAILEAWAAGRSGDEGPLGVLHCFSGDLALARRYVALGFLISFAGVVTYPKNEALREAAQALPSDAIVVETDCPYLTPQSQRGRRNEPAYVAETVRFLAELRGVPAAVLREQTWTNARRLFRLPAGETLGE